MYCLVCLFSLGPFSSLIVCLFVSFLKKKEIVVLATRFGTFWLCGGEQNTVWQFVLTLYPLLCVTYTYNYQSIIMYKGSKNPLNNTRQSPNYTKALCVYRKLFRVHRQIINLNLLQIPFLVNIPRNVRDWFYAHLYFPKHFYTSMQSPRTCEKLFGPLCVG